MREFLAPLAAVSILTLSACSGDNPDTTPTPTTIPTFSGPINGPATRGDEETISTPPETFAPADGVTPETTEPEEEVHPETTPYTTEPYEEPIYPEYNRPDDTIPSLLDSEIGNLAICDAVLGPAQDFAGIVDADPFDIEDGYRHMSVNSFLNYDEDAEIEAVRVRGLGEEKYDVDTSEGISGQIDVSSGDDAFEFGENGLILAGRQEDGSVILMMSCVVEMLVEPDGSETYPELPAGDSELSA